MPSTSGLASPALSKLVPTTSTRLIFSRGAPGSSEPSAWVTLSLSSYSPASTSSQQLLSHTQSILPQKGGQSRADTLSRNLAVDGPLKSYIDVAASAYAADQSLHNTFTNNSFNKGYAQFPNCFALDTIEGSFKSGMTLTSGFTDAGVTPAIWSFS
ncbi:hypothetical protein N7471_009381 [Penicillium samsonianum]|uniref:uncharacterized protein n=1 Tax=Penicillium samsonianum TaxID=1882272 RepID=UPI0025466064|nr:uncharacterized protein N7471_009381 [Penicillium samsonianum]KAJ6128164.1 hypothetical protein N7471_009381 [Penicillium samsonianum]